MKTRYQHPGTLVALCLLILTLAACGGSAAPDAQQLISKAQIAIQKVTAYHFNLATQNPGSGGLLVITGADGDILVPDKLQANAKALIFGSVVNVKIISIGQQQYYTDPITQKWSATTGLLDPR